MVGPSNPKTLHLLQDFSLNKPIPSCTLSSNMEIIKNLFETLIFSHLKPLIHALSKAKSKLVSIIVQILKSTNQPMQLIFHPTSKKKMKINKKKKKIFFGSFRLHYNWCSSSSSHVLPVPQPVFDGLVSNHMYYDSSRNSTISTHEQKCVSEDCDHHEEKLYGYLQWLEDQKVCDKYSSSTNEPDVNELAELFIASCHEKFMLEKQESNRRFQEMLARSM